MIHSIYLITNKVNDKKYVGYTSHEPERRWHEHCKSSTKSLVANAIRKYGKDNFEFLVIYQSLDRDYTLFVMEEFFIRLYDAHANDGHGYNRSYGGTSNNRGIKYGQDVRDRMSLSQIGVTRLSGPAISRALKGRPISDEHRRKLSVAQTGKTMSEEAKANMRKPKNFSVEQRKAMASRMRKVTNRSTGDKHHRSIRVQINGITYETITAASKELGISGATIRRRLNGVGENEYPTYRYA